MNLHARVRALEQHARRWPDPAAEEARRRELERKRLIWGDPELIHLLDEIWARDFAPKGTQEGRRKSVAFPYADTPRDELYRIAETRMAERAAALGVSL